MAIGRIFIPMELDQFTVIASDIANGDMLTVLIGFV